MFINTAMRWIETVSNVRLKLRYFTNAKNFESKSNIMSNLLKESGEVMLFCLI